jgi:hypothetical protein
MSHLGGSVGLTVVPPPDGLVVVLWVVVDVGRVVVDVLGRVVVDVFGRVVVDVLGRVVVVVLDVVVVKLGL